MSKVLKKITLIILLITIILGINTIVNADDTVKTSVEKIFTSSDMGQDRDMPARDTSGDTGLFPQKYLGSSGRFVKLPDSRYDLETDTWTAYIDGKIVYCARRGSYVRYGYFDPAKHYLLVNSNGTSNTTIQGVTIDLEFKDKIIEKNGEVIADTIKNKLFNELQEDFALGYMEETGTWTGRYYENGEPIFEVKKDNITVNPIYDNTVKRSAIGGIVTNDDFINNTVPDWAKDKIIKDMEEAGQKSLEASLNYLKGALGTAGWSPDIDGNPPAELEAESATTPYIVVMEDIEKSAVTKDTDHTSVAGYYDRNINKEYNTAISSKEELVREQNIMASYILTALENAYKYETGECVGEYNLNDIQTAYWLLLFNKFSGHRDPGSFHITDNGYKLYGLALQYYNFIVESDNFEKLEDENDKYVSIKSNDAKVIVDKSDKDIKYIIGPFNMNYPFNEDISYIKSLEITTNNNKKLTCSWENKSSDFEIICDGANTSTMINGIKMNFPKNNTNFFIEVSADKLEGATDIRLIANFEYLKSAKQTYTDIETKANVYKYEGGTSVFENAVRYTISYKTARYTGLAHSFDCQQYHKDEAGNMNFSCVLGCKGRKVYVNDNVVNYQTNTSEQKYGPYDVYQPYIKMYELPVASVTPQNLIKTDKGEREYNVIERKTNIINITMELGGYVWVNEESGKLSEKNDIKDDFEKVVPGVKVILYKYNKDKEDEKVAETHTDNNGKYLFTQLDARYNYYVEFIYNGQYYQPIKYVSPKDEAEGWYRIFEWKRNSNATDKREERIKFNEKFASIGDYSYNYTVGDSNRKTFTKEYLLGYRLQEDGTYEKKAKAVIDEFGNLIKTQPENQEEMEMIQYVRDCQISAYTGKDNLTTNLYVYDLYPIDNIFRIDDKKYNEITNILPDYKLFYPSAYYINLGLEAREEADISVKKDVSKVTLEINGKTHEYTYDTLDAASNPNREEEWNIDVRLSDGYYNKQYTRELYKSDYLFKVSDYGAKAQELGKTEDDELKVFVTYKIMVGNRSSSLRIRPDELVDYYDKEYTYVAERSYIKLTKQNGREYYTDMYNVKACEISEYAQETQITKEGYKKLYIKGFKGCKELGIGAEKIDEKGNLIETIADGVYLEAGETAYIYLTFEVNKDSNGRVILDEEIGEGKENVVEINGYSTQYPKGATVPNVFELDENGNERLKDLEGTTPGRVDRDSNPGNLKPEDLTKPEKYEDDTDKAPNIRIRLYEGENQDRVISGKAWEDERTNKVELTTTGDGIRNEKETLINGVTVQLVEIMNNGTEFVWRETSTGTKKEETPIINYENLVSNYEFTDQNGSYAFKSFIPGNYVVRFIYGDTIKTVAPSSLNLGGLNEKSYNGQDYKSTTYQKGVTQNNSYIVREASKFVNGQEILGDVITIVPTFKSDASNNETLTLNRETLKFHNDAYKNNRVAYLYDVLASNEKTNVSDAKDIASRRSEVTNYSDNNVRNYIAEVLASHKSDYNTMNDRNQLLNDLMQNTKMRAETGLVVVEFEKGIPNSDGTKLDNSYVIDNVDLGLEERPKAQVIMNKEVTNVKLTLADGSILFDANNPSILTPNVVWDAHKGYETGYKNNLLDSNKFASLENIRKQNADKFGFIQLNMDEELMHGATIKISYKMTVQNVGEVDYIDNQYYYTGVKSPNAQVVKTKVEKVIDYVANNLQFYAKDNINWDVIKQEELLSQGLVNEKLKDQVAKYNTVIVTDDFAAELVPALYKEVNKNAQDSISVPLVLTQLITTENEEDDLQYRNIVEIAEISNTAGRRQEYSVVGNQDPTVEPQELDTDIAEVVKILPPFGNTTMYVIIAIITIAAAGIITTGAIFIKKKVLTK